MIVEYIPLNLREALPDLELHDRLMVLTHLSSALHHMHELGITHRDVKPDNALIEKRENGLTVKLADFGTSKHSVTGKMDTFSGTATYMAPEVFERPRLYTNKVDIWSLGLIGVQMFTSWHPPSDENWDPNDFGDWMRSVIAPHVHEAPEKFRPLLGGLLRKKPERRWSAWKCLRWLWKNGEVDDGLQIVHRGGVDECAVGTRKRPASTLDDGSFEVDGHDRHRRSPNPSVSTTRARAVHDAAHHSERSSTIPDTLSPGESVVETLSAIATPHADDKFSNNADSEDDESSGYTDVELEVEWNDTTA